jgi:hypothetical protein
MGVSRWVIRVVFLETKHPFIYKYYHVKYYCNME